VTSVIPTELEQLTRHMAWADAVVWRAVFEEACVRCDARVRFLLHHLHTVQWAYLQLFRRETVDVPDEDAFPDLGALYRWARRYHEEAPAFLSTLDEQALDAPVELPWASYLEERFGTVHPANVRQSILQVTSHSAYHRGQLNSRIREVGGEPPLTDFVAWVWIGAPQAPWLAGVA
jgi:uncharacterized damage-inducible protein DinB